jgi:hypothetical protein
MPFLGRYYSLKTAWARFGRDRFLLAALMGTTFAGIASSARASARTRSRSFEACW